MVSITWILNVIYELIFYRWYPPPTYINIIFISVDKPVPNHTFVKTIIVLTYLILLQDLVGSVGLSLVVYEYKCYTIVRSTKLEIRL